MKKKRQALIYLVFFITGILSYQDFGISVDEWDLRVQGFVNLKYIMEILFQNSSVKLDEILLVPKISDFSGNTHGAIFNLLMTFVEYFFDKISSHPKFSQDSKNRTYKIVR